jgi:hypothetical protein
MCPLRVGGTWPSRLTTAIGAAQRRPARAARQRSAADVSPKAHIDEIALRDGKVRHQLRSEERRRRPTAETERDEANGRTSPGCNATDPSR